MSKQTRAFTLLELLVSVGIIVLLASITLIGLRGVRASANRANSTNALRMIMRGYAGYSVDSNQQLMPGYMKLDTLILLGITANAPDGKPLADRADASSYVWRLAPYLDNEWKTLFIDYRSKELVALLWEETLTGIYGPGSADPGGGKLGVSLIPAFGLNSIYVGGDDVHCGNDIARDRNPWNPAIPSDILAATRLSEVKNPAKLIVFAPTVHFGEVLDPRVPLVTDASITSLAFGYAELRPPFIQLDRDDPDSRQKQWHMAQTFTLLDGNFSASDNETRPIGGGVPVARWGKDLIPTGRLDGSVITDDLQQLAQDEEGRNWSPHATGLFSN